MATDTEKWQVLWHEAGGRKLTAGHPALTHTTSEGYAAAMIAAGEVMPTISKSAYQRVRRARPAGDRLRAAATEMENEQ